MLKRVVWDPQTLFTRYAQAITGKLRRGDFKEIVINVLKSRFGWDLSPDPAPAAQQSAALTLSDCGADSGLLALAGIAGYYRIAADWRHLSNELALRGLAAGSNEIVRAAKLIGLKARSHRESVVEPPGCSSGSIDCAAQDWRLLRSHRKNERGAFSHRRSRHAERSRIAAG